eukprot:1161140-Pelagomonas_calceolata.AAC.6
MQQVNLHYEGIGELCANKVGRPGLLSTLSLYLCTHLISEPGNAALLCASKSRHWGAHSTLQESNNQTNGQS